MTDSDHKPESVIVAELAAAAKDVEIGATYRHYKQQDYKVLHLAINESDNDLTVVYQALYGAGLIFLRPLNSWMATVEYKGQKLPRFTKV